MNVIYECSYSSNLCAFVYDQLSMNIMCMCVRIHILCACVCAYMLVIIRKAIIIVFAL